MFTLGVLLALAATPLLSAQELVAGPSSTARQSTGTITGRVFDQATGEALENARVVLDGSTHAVITERGGYFSLRAVPPGDHTLITSYSGFDAVRQTVRAEAGRDTTVRVDMSSGTVELSAFVVNFRRGEADEIMLRRQATNVVDVVSSKTFGEMADGSLSISPVSYTHLRAHETL